MKAPSRADTLQHGSVVRGVYRLFETLFQVREDEFKLVQAFFLYFAVIGMFYTIGATAGETLFLARLGSEAAERLLPWVYIGIAVSTVAVTLVYNWLEPRVPRIKLLVAAHVSLAASLAAFRFAVQGAGAPVFFALTVWVESCELFAMTIVFSFAGDYFTSRDARRLYGYITAGLGTGILVSGYAVAPLVDLLGTERLLYLCALLLAACSGVAWWISRFARPLEHPDSEEDGDQAPLRTVFSSRYLQIAFVLVLLCSVCTVLADFEMKIVASRSMGEEALAVWFGKFYGLMGVASLVVQFLVVGWLLGRLGIVKSMMLLPVLLVLTSLAALAKPVLLSVAVSNFVLLTLSETLDMPALELLFLPLPQRLRLRAQTLVDGALNPIGHGIGGALLLAMIFVSFKVEHTAALVAALSAAWLCMIFAVGPKYREVLTSSLSGRSISRLDLESLLKRGDGRAVLAGLLDKGSRELRLSTLDLLGGRPLGLLEAPVARLAGGEDEDVAARALGLLGAHGSRESLAAARAALARGSARVQAAAALAVCRLAGEDAAEEVSPLLDSPSAEVRSAALSGLARHGGFSGALLAYPRIEALLKSPREGERSQAAAVLGRVGMQGAERALVRLLADPSQAVRREALAAARELRAPALVPHLVRSLDEPKQRALALRALDAMPREAVPAMGACIRDSSNRLTSRAALARALGGIGGPDAARLLWDTLAPEQELLLRWAAARALKRVVSREGPPAVEAAAVDARLDRLCKGLGELRRAAAGVGACPAGGLLTDRVRLESELLLALLALRFDAHRLSRIEAHLFGASEPLRANALELLEQLLPHALAKRVVPLLAEPAPRHGARKGPEEAARRLLDADPWLRAIAIFHLADGAPLPSVLGGRPMTAEDISLHQVVTTVSFLKRVELFESVPADFLASVAHIVEERQVYPGEKLFAQGDDGDSLYLIRSGRVRILVDGKETAVLGSGDHLGEMALLDGAPRSATAVVAEEARLLRIASEDFRDLLAAQPGISMSLLVALVRRLRKAAGPGGAKP